MRLPSRAFESETLKSCPRLKRRTEPQRAIKSTSSMLTLTRTQRLMMSSARQMSPTTLKKLSWGQTALFSLMARRTLAGISLCLEKTTLSLKEADSKFLMTQETQEASSNDSLKSSSRSLRDEEESFSSQPVCTISTSTRFETLACMLSKSSSKATP